MKIGLRHTFKNIFSDFIDGLLYKLGKRATYEENRSGSKTIIKEISDDGILDKATILLTPTAYSDARLHSVKTQGDELITNGDFATDSDWTEGAGWDINTTTKVADRSGETGNSAMSQSISVVNGKSYKFSYTRNYISGNGETNIYSKLDNVSYTTLGSYTSTVVEEHTVTGIFVAGFTGSMGLNVYGIGTFTGNIDNISVKDVSSDFDFERDSSATRVDSDGLIQDMQSITDPELVENGDFSEISSDLGTNMDFSSGTSPWALNPNWSLGGVGVIADGTSNSTVWQNSVVQDNKFYKVTYTLTDFTQGTVNVELGGTNGISRTIAGTYTEILQAGTSPTTRITFEGSGSFKVTLSNISVKQLDPDDDWTLGTGWSLGDGELVHTGSGDYAVQGSLTTGNQYEVVIVVTQASGSDFPQIYMGGLTTAMTSPDTYTFNITAQSGDTIKLRGLNDCKVASVSVIDVTFSEDVDLPRIDYTGGVGHILLEPASTNLITYSEDFSQWSQVNYTVQSNVGVSPSGNNDASSLTNPSGGGGVIKQNTTVTASTNYTFSFYAKIGTASDVKYSVYDNTNGGDIIASTSYYSQLNSSTFTRVTVSFTTPVGCTDIGAYILRDNVAAGTVIVWGAQLEALSYATSYIPTHTGTTVTRDAETLDGSGNDTLISSTEGVLYCEIAALNESNLNSYISIGQNTTDGILGISLYTGSNNILLDHWEGVSETYHIESISDVTEFNKIAICYNGTSIKGYINGTPVWNTTITAWSSNALSELNFKFGGSANNFYGKTKCLAVFDEALEDDELAALTS